jgi:bifunctional DNase/RNase
MSSFSGEVAAMISNFTNGDRVSIPTIYKLIEDLEDRMGIMLVRVEIYNSKENVMRSDLFFVDRNNKQVKLEGYKASDAIALAAYHDVEIFVEDKLLARASA